MAFTNYGTLNPHGAPVNIRRTIANSTTVTVNDSMKMDSGFADLGEATTDVLGHADGISTEGGVGVVTDGSAGADFGSYQGTFTTASDNQTVDKVKVELDISKDSLYSAEVDAAIETTAGYSASGAYMDLLDEDTLDESTGATTPAQYYSHGVDPEDDSRLIVNIFQSSVFGS